MVTCHVEPTHNEDRERLLRTVKLDVARLALAAGFDVILDDTHLVPATVAHIHAFAAELGAVRVIEKAFNLPVHECFARNARRPRATRVPRKVILRMARAAALDASNELQDREAYYPSAADPGAPPEGEER